MEKLKAIFLWVLAGGVVLGALRLAVLVVKFPAVAITFFLIACFWVLFAWGGLFVLALAHEALTDWLEKRARARRTTWRRA